MEKPPPSYTITSRYAPSANESRDIRKRYTDRLTLLGVPALSDQVDETDKPRWRGDHSFSSDAATYSLINFIEPEVASQHPDWSHEAVKGEAMARFEKRLRQDLSYEQKESAHEESTVTWQPVQTERGWELGTVYGDKMVTLSELWEHTREYAAFAGNPAAYNSQEHRAQLTMQEALIGGQATGFVSALSHPDSVRYVQVWQKAQDGTIVSRHIDLWKTTGRDLSHEEGVKLIQHLALFHGEVQGKAAEQKEYAHFLVHEKNIMESDIRTISTALVMETRTDTAAGGAVSFPDFIAGMGIKSIRDTTDSMMMLGMYVRDQIDRSVERMRERLDMRPHTPNPKRTHRFGEPRKEAKGILTPHRRNKVHGDLPRKETLPSGGELIKSIVADWWITQRLVRYAAHVPVAAVAVLTWLDISRHDSEITQFSMRTALAEKLPKTKGVMVELFRLIPQKRERPKRRMRRMRAGEARTDTKDRERVTQATVRRKERSKEISLRIVHFVIAKLRTLSALVPKIEPSPSALRFPRTRVREQKHEAHTRKKDAFEQPAVQRLLFALLYLWLIRVPIRVSPAPGDIFRDEVPQQVHLYAVGESTPRHQWVLLSIIWYLTALREQGKPSTQRKPKQAAKSGKTGVFYPPVSLPASGTIFAYGS